MTEKIKNEIINNSEISYIEPKTNDSFYIDLDNMTFTWYEDVTISSYQPLVYKVTISDIQKEEIINTNIFSLEYENGTILFYQESEDNNSNIKYIYWFTNNKTYIIETNDLDPSRLNLYKNQ